MRAVRVVGLNGPAGVEYADVDAPPPDPRQIRIKVEAAGVTFPDVLLSRGRYQVTPPLPFIPGSQVAGRVLEAPADSGLRRGDRVAGLCYLGGFAEEVLIPPDRVVALEPALSFVSAAGALTNYLTADFALRQRGALAAGETVLIHGAAGGVGTAAVQIAACRGARVIAVTSTPAKAEIARRAGAAHTVSAGSFLDEVRTLTSGEGVQLVLDTVGGDGFTDSLRCLGPEGRLLVVGFAAGSIPSVKVNRLLLKNTAVIGVAWGEFVRAHPGLLQAQWTQLRPYFADRRLDPIVGTSLPLAQAGAALSRLENREATGQTILTIGPEATP